MFQMNGGFFFGIIIMKGTNKTINNFWKRETYMEPYMEIH